MTTTLWDGYEAAAQRVTEILLDEWIDVPMALVIAMVAGTGSASRSLAAEQPASAGLRASPA